jgi:hypothetical protein
MKRMLVDVPVSGKRNKAAKIIINSHDEYSHRKDNEVDLFLMKPLREHKGLCTGIIDWIRGYSEQFLSKDTKAYMQYTILNHVVTNSFIRDIYTKIKMAESKKALTEYLGKMSDAANDCNYMSVLTFSCGIEENARELLVGDMVLENRSAARIELRKDKAYLIDGKVKIEGKGERL